MTGIIVAAVIGYLLGSIPFGIVLTRLAGLDDIRHIGSGSIGATNVLRTGNKMLAALTLLLDLAKGVAAVLIGRIWGGDAMLAAAGAVIVGHMFPVWLGCRGGRGVGPGTFYARLRRVGSACAPLEALGRLPRPVSAMSRRDAEAELAALDRLGGYLVAGASPLIPPHWQPSRMRRPF